jgi:hypothetical protein
MAEQPLRGYTKGMKPRLAYRLTVCLLPLAAVMVILGLLDGAWLVVACGAIAAAGALVNLRAARRRGINWNGPKTFRELRERQAR